MLAKRRYYVTPIFCVSIVMINVCMIYIDKLQSSSDENIQTIPTIGFNVEVLQYKNIKFQVIIVTTDSYLYLLSCIFI